MDNLSVNFLGAKRKLTRWLRIFKTRSRKAQPFSGSQAVGLVLMAVGAVSIVLVLVTWALVVLVAPSLPASKWSLAKSEEAATLTATALRKFLPGHDVRIERLFAYNLKLYVDRKPFEDIPYPDRKAMMAKIGRSWCDNIEYRWLARVGVFDIRSGKKLSAHACVFGRLKEIILG
jgi:hypothetical protein